MGKTYVLDRVAADLARGFTHPAIQRLSSLVAAYPNDLDLRRRLAAVHRRVGNRIQAGRWDYLTIGADSRDTQAFERAFPSAVARLREVRWPYRASEAATAYARRRLAKLIAAAEAERPDIRVLSAGSSAAGAASAVPGASGTGAPPGRLAPVETVSADGTAGTGRGLARLVGPLRQRWPVLRTRRVAIAAGTAGMLLTPPIVVGAVTVIQWMVQ